MVSPVKKRRVAAAVAEPEEVVAKAREGHQLPQCSLGGSSSELPCDLCCIKKGAKFRPLFSPNLNPT